MDKNKISKTCLYLSSLGLYSDEISYMVKKFEDPIFALETNILDGTLSMERKIRKKYLARSADLNTYLDFMDENKISYLTYFDDDFPPSLKQIPDPPMVLYYKGQLKTSRPGISVVGSRKCTDYGKWACQRMVEDLSDYGVSIISGLALGIDKVAHKTALDKGLYTLGVLGCGVDRIYPLANKTIFKRMEEEGCILSEFPLGTEPLAHHFPIRNRLISGLGLGLLVVEAKLKSGTLITAGFAADQGREVFAIPGNINSLFSQGTNALIRDGAKLVSCGKDIAEEFPDLIKVKEEAKKIQRDLSSLSSNEAKVYKALALDPLATDDLSRSLDLDIQTILSCLTLMELKGLVVELDGRWTIN